MGYWPSRHAGERRRWQRRGFDNKTRANRQLDVIDFRCNKWSIFPDLSSPSRAPTRSTTAPHFDGTLCQQQHPKGINCSPNFLSSYPFPIQIYFMFQSIDGTRRKMHLREICKILHFGSDKRSRLIFYHPPSSPLLVKYKLCTNNRIAIPSRRPAAVTISTRALSASSLLLLLL